MKKYANTGISMKLAGFVVAALIAGITSIFCLAFTPMQDQDEEPGPWTAPASADHMVNPVNANESILSDAKGLYKRNCEQCHGLTGKGDGWQSLNVAKTIAAISSPVIQKQSDGALYWKITQGRKPMPSMKKDLSEEQRWKLVLYVRELGRLQDK